VLIAFGFNATNSFSSDVSRFLSGSPAGKAIWMFGAGNVTGVIGLIGVTHRSKQSDKLGQEGRERWARGATART